MRKAFDFCFLGDYAYRQTLRCNEIIFPTILIDNTVGYFNGQGHLLLKISHPS